ncbi:SDR family NAD(P)-dependent oxidoreductase [Novosphingobium cyanobacteriorum]|uniref:SDR family oxidoreductase n=1 Tax=Novosphingobium cyanobacteriorum TaxID=3024215 RepID=A0ABT6CND7_9SPHN|nr:SDR family oxidoreductase [Novosphingobium cyanobacteriorum]MDF8335367.1 SDR family oxidoreductase [Novosphingobium cyanobacteriorum]
MDKRHAGKVAVITGAAAGIGRAYALRLASEGADIAVVDLNDAGPVAAEITAVGGRAKAYQCDVSQPESVAKLGAAVLADFERCDVLVNNAGIFPSRRFEDIELEHWRQMLAVNLDSVFLVSKQFVPGMRERKWGRVVNMASNSFGQVAPGLTHYIAAKGGVIGFTRALASELGPEGITVNAIAPGFVRTEGTLARAPNFRGQTSEELYGILAERQAIPRPPTPEDMAGVLSYLASSDADLITAQTFYVDGGLVRVS